MNEKLRRLGLLPAAAAALFALPGPAFSGDEDKDPAYMIYIDPETGKYTTEDPSADATPDAAAVPSQSPRATRSDTPYLVAVTSLLAILLVFAIVRHQRKPVV
ncbi:MAG: hypothetical protein OEM51_07015 [Gammaproteobacteria bacterium]|nr:hypothetical protein [Gammaproteobacteria bacterium]